MEFKDFNKIARLSREMVITEKIDGTNGQIAISEDGTYMKVGSRSRWLSSDFDNYNFYRWCMENQEELMKLGPGRHWGEWWGHGIQRNYGLKEKRFSLFNTRRWDVPERPSCCSVVPLLHVGVFDTQVVTYALDQLKLGGSVAAPGFMKPEGIVIYHTASGTLFKKTVEKDDKPKGQE